MDLLMYSLSMLICVYNTSLRMVMSMSGSDSAATYGSVSLGIVHIRKPVKLQHLEQNFPQFWGVPPTVPLYKLSSSTKPELNN